MQFTQRIRNSCALILHAFHQQPGVARPRMRDRPSHRKESEETEEGEHDVVHQHEVLEAIFLANAPRLLLPLTIVGIEVEDAEDIDSCEGEGYLRPENEVVEILVYCKR